MGLKVLSLAPLPGDLVKLLIQQTQGVPDFEVVSGHELEDGDLLRAVSEADVVLGDYTFNKKITADIVNAAGRLKMIQQPSVGYQHIDVDACTLKGIRVANTAGANTVSVAEHTIAWALCLLKNLFFAHTSTKLGGWEQMNVKPVELKGKIWGIVGFGRIGQALAARLRPFELERILYYDIIRQPRNMEEELDATFCELPDLLQLSDIVSLHAPLTETTRCMIDEHAFHAMKPTAYLINVARAELVDEEALARAIMAKTIAGAGIDVFSEEPVRLYNPLLDVESDKFLLSPHTAGVSDEAAGRIINMATANIAKVLKGEEPDSLVNP
ncbi:MAG: 2-hydroxyacid dehydrogenase [Desulfomonilia bacterium]